MKNIYICTPDQTVSYAAEELKKYLFMMMPEGEYPTVSYVCGEDGIRLGLMSEFGLDTSDCEDTFLDDVIYIDCDADGGVIAGSNPRSVLLAVYEYLRQNGCRWLYPGVDGEYIPLKDIVPVKYRYKPSMRFRGMCDEGASSQQCMLEAIEFYPKIGLNMISLEFFNPIAYYDAYYSHDCNRANRAPEPVSDETVLQWRKMCECETAKRGLLLLNVGHGWTVKPFGMQEWGDAERRKLPEECRQYMALVNGERGLINGMPHITNVCMSNPEARRRIVRTAVDYAKRQRNVSHLAINYADGFNRHCECEECAKKLPSDWMVILLNEMDRELTLQGVDTRISLAVYEDTCWAPAKEKLNNPNRYIITAAMIWRDFTESVPECVPEVRIPEYVRNKNKSVSSLDMHMTCVKEWQRQTEIKNVISFDYHFWRYYYFDVGTASICRIIHEDVKAFLKNGFCGVVEDSSQRSYFPNGFGVYVYARTLFDTSLFYETIAEDYFSHIYGNDWREVYSFFERMTELFSHKYVSGMLSEDGNSGNRYAPEREADFYEIEQYARDFRSFISKRVNMPYRVQTVSYRLLLRYTDYCIGLARAFAFKCRGDDERASEIFAEFLREFGKYELELERYYDQSLVALSFDTYSRIFKGAANSQSQVNVI